MDPSSLNFKEDRKMFYDNQILGVPRIRQVRVKHDSCKIHPNMQRFFNNCYNSYSIYSEETSPIKKGMDNKLTKTALVAKFFLNNQFNNVNKIPV